MFLYKIYYTCFLLYLLFNYILQHSLGASRGKIKLQTEEIADSKYTIGLHLSATKLDKKDFFGKVSLYGHKNLFGTVSMDTQVGVVMCEPAL